MIRSDWRVALNALQIVAEQGPGLMQAVEGQAEDDAYARSRKALNG